MKLKNLIGVFLTIVLVTNCTNESAVTQEVCFENEVLPIFNASCNYIGCHNGIDKASRWDLSNYQGIYRGITPGNYRSSKMYQVLVGSPIMPPSPYDKLSTKDLITIATWIQQGAKNTTCPPAVCDTNSVSLSKDVSPIFQRYCSACHLINRPQAGVDLRTYDYIRQVVDDGTLIRSIKYQSSAVKNMPPGNRLPSCDVLLIEAWVNQGALDN